jgi:hypothetical protein
MRILPPNVPPPLPIETSWRELWRSNAFAQRSTILATRFLSTAAEREFRPGAGDGALEELDLAGALQPIMFAQDWVRDDVVDVTPYEPHLRFREEEPVQSWSEYAWEPHGHKSITALYSPWQILYLDEVIARSGERVPLSLLGGPPDDLAAWIEKLRELVGNLDASWRSLHDDWQPLIKLLVRLQNRYLPETSRQSTFLWDEGARTRIEPWKRERQSFDAHAMMTELHLDTARVQDAYWFLVERGISREPRDGMELLRRARPRQAHTQWRGAARHAEDHFEAAHMLYLFLTDLTGVPPPRPNAWPLDGRQEFRAYLFDRGPVPDVTRDEVRGALFDVEVDPHAVHVVGEGKCEREYVETIARAFVGSQQAARIGYTDLKGSGAAALLPTIVRGLSTYVGRTVVIVDSEGKMKNRTDELERTGVLPATDILRFARNIEEDNFSLTELIDALTNLAANPLAGITSVALTLTEAEVEAAYKKRPRKGRDDDPGLAGVLLHLAERHDPPVRIAKPVFSVALAERLLDAYEATDNDSAARDALFKRRPVLAFALDRIIPALYGFG